MFLSFLVSIVGLAFVYRTSQFFLMKVGLHQHHRRLFVILAVIAEVFFLFHATKPLHLWIFFGTILILLSVLPHFFLFQREKLIKSHTLLLLDRLILGVQGGQSLKKSLLSCCSEAPPLLRLQWENLHHALVYQMPPTALSSRVLRSLYEEILRIERSQNKCLEQLLAFRKQVKTIESFRRRSGQVALQLRMQAFISAILYLALLVFVISQFGFVKHKTLIICSFWLFAVGVVTIFVIGRRMKWKV